MISFHSRLWCFGLDFKQAVVFTSIPWILFSPDLFLVVILEKFGVVNIYLYRFEYLVVVFLHKLKCIAGIDLLVFKQLALRRRVGFQKRRQTDMVVLPKLQGVKLTRLWLFCYWLDCHVAWYVTTMLVRWLVCHRIILMKSLVPVGVSLSLRALLQMHMKVYWRLLSESGLGIDCSRRLIGWPWAHLACIAS